MSKKKCVPIELMNTYREASLEKCVEMYNLDKTRTNCNIGFVLRSIIGVKVIYGEHTRKEDSSKVVAPDTKHADMSLVNFYYELPLDQCIQLYKMQHDNVNRSTRFALRAMIAAKYIYGDAYVSIKNQQ